MYTLELTANDVETIAWVGDRYGWSASLLHLSEGVNTLTEAEAWEIADGIESDMEGGHDGFPCLDHNRSELGTKLIGLLEELV